MLHISLRIGIVRGFGVSVYYGKDLQVDSLYPHHSSKKGLHPRAKWYILDLLFDFKVMYQETFRKELLSCCIEG